MITVCYVTLAFGFSLWVDSIILRVYCSEFVTTANQRARCNDILVNWVKLSLQIDQTKTTETKCEIYYLM